MPLCSPRVQAVAAPAGSAAQSQAGTPTARKHHHQHTAAFRFLFQKGEMKDTPRNVNICTALSPTGTVPGQLSVES